MMDLLQADSVAFRYPQDGRGMPPISFLARQGEAIYIRGPSGCGKSTLARCLTGLIPHLYQGEFNGSVCVDGLYTDQSPLWKISEKIGLVFQNPAAQILASTVEEEILFGLENLGVRQSEASLRLESALEQFELASMRLRSPHGLSGGEQQKLALAAATARETPVMVLDEPLSMLDTTSAFNFIEILSEQIQQGRTMILCEHRHEYMQALPALREIRLNGLPSPNDQLPAGIWPASQKDSFSLHVSDLQVSRSGRTILERVNFSLENGQVIALVGRNGAGKTTLLPRL